MRLTGDLQAAEDAVQEACLAAVAQWPATGVPERPDAWVTATAKHKALDRARREARRLEKEAAAMRELYRQDEPALATSAIVDDQLSLIFLCCHPALDLAVRVPLTLRSVCGLTTTEIAAAFLVPETTMAQRLVRAKRKIRDAHTSFALPRSAAFPERLSAVLRVIYLVYTEGHRSVSGRELVRPALCEEAIRLARALLGLLPKEPEVAGLLALLLLTDARRPGRLDDDGNLVLLPDQDRARWNSEQIAEGSALLAASLRRAQPGSYQIQAAIAACHSTATQAAGTDWAEIAALYRDLLRYDPSAVVQANRAVAIAMAHGPAAGLALLDSLLEDPRLTRWSQLHVARAELLGRLRQYAAAGAAYQAALALTPPPAEQVLIRRRLQALPTSRRDG